VPEVTRQVYISAVDSSGAPVTDLTAADIAVKEGGKERQVASLQPAVAPMQVASLVDVYLLTYTLPDGVKPADRLSVSTSRKGVTLIAPSRRHQVVRRARTAWRRSVCRVRAL
jgi:hypothetical protein